MPSVRPLLFAPWKLEGFQAESSSASSEAAELAGCSKKSCLAGDVGPVLACFESASSERESESLQELMEGSLLLAWALPSSSLSFLLEDGDLVCVVSVPLAKLHIV